MRSARLFLLAAASVAVLTAASPALAQQVQPTDPWAQATSDIPADTNVRFGVMPNGMQYAIMRNATPPGQASFRLRLDAGSLMENEDQLGLAHFMEHMAFNGTTNIPENDLLRILERLGLAFGADTNASTGFDQTIYMLELPRTNDETVDTSLRIMREQVSEALMAADAVDAERGVIEGEERLRNTPGLRSIKAQLALLAPGQRVSQRLPIGDLNVIRNAPRERFVEFYDAYYRPSRATFVAVGDFDLDVMEAKIRGAFESWQPRAADGPEPDLGTVAPREPETRILVEPGVQSSIQLNWIRNPDLDPDTVSERRDDLLRGLGVAVLNRRLGEIARADNPPFSGAGGGESGLVNSLDIATVTAQFAPGEWKRALEAIEQEQRRLVQYGVSEAELQREITTIRSSLENAVAGAATRRTPQLAGGLVNAVNEGDVFTSPRTNLDLFNAAVEGVTAAQISEAVKPVFTGEGPLALLVTPVEIEGGEAAVTAALEASRQVPVAAPAAQARMDWPYASFGAPGEVQNRQELAEVGATVVTFANGVRLTVKPTTFRDEQILISVRTGIGERGMSPERADPQLLAAAIVPPGGLGRLTFDELSRTLNGRIYSAGFQVGGDSYQLQGGTRPEDLALQMQVLAAYLTDPGLRPAPMQLIKSVFPQQIAQLMATPGGAFQIQGSGLLASGDKRESLPSAEEVAAWTIEDLRASITSGLASGPIDVIVVGDLTVEDAIAAVAPTFGALPARGPDAQPAAGATELRFPAPTAEPVRLTHTGPAEQALAYIAWPTTDAVGDRTDARRASILSEVLNLRVLEEIRERQALAYSPRVQAGASNFYEDYGSISIMAETAADKLDAFYAAVETIAASLRDAPPSEDELNRARLPVIESLRRSQASNEYWLAQLSDVAERPADVEQIQTHISDLEAITPADIQALARQYLTSDTAWRAVVLSTNAQ
ncbi:MAG: insulinase family protein [Alphaproteobacteria bacterium]|jgi:zinc protease|nr:insulinase family protein [Alphaproteobacteria bacterium]MBU2041240.1 insulinase family protein [Alphaproteobacteria bacterium]MBU2124713.1 insulinase family protein [Alphaproteobacteria bacterium]MBU2209625.1 insulinase family protein [Alphaproteobacteria bacterium]MBU2290906.1 insulinase family protein [Alphaproteobacteria bacterium]